MKYGYVGHTEMAGAGYGGDPADIVAREANRRSLDHDPPQELASFSVTKGEHAYLVHMVFRWALELPGEGEETKR